jgi:hypothetical protein
MINMPSGDELMARDSRRTCVPRSQVISGRSVTVTNRRQKVRWLATGFPATDLVRLSECHGDGEVVGASVLIDRFAHSANWRSAGPRGAHTASRIQDHEQAGSEYLNLFEDHASPYLIIQYTAAPPLRLRDWFTHAGCQAHCICMIKLRGPRRGVLPWEACPALNGALGVLRSGRASRCGLCHDPVGLPMGCCCSHRQPVPSRSVIEHHHRNVLTF